MLYLWQGYYVYQRLHLALVIYEQNGHDGILSPPIIDFFKNGLKMDVFEYGGLRIYFSSCPGKKIRLHHQKKDSHDKRTVSQY